MHGSDVFCSSEKRRLRIDNILIVPVKEILLAVLVCRRLTRPKTSTRDVIQQHPVLRCTK